MRSIIKPIALAGVTLTLLFGSNQLNAQDRPGRGNFDPEQFRERMTQMTRERLEIKDDDEWKIIQPRLEKVMEARRETMTGIGGFGFAGGRGGGPGAPGGFGGRREGGNQERAERGDRGGERAERGDRGGFRGARQNPEAEALQSAIESNASPEQIKAKLAALREARKQKQANLEKAQADLRKVLTARQEALAVLNNILD